MNDDINVYPTTDMYIGHKTRDEVLEEIVNFIIEELYFGRRFSGEDIVKLAKLAQAKIESFK